MKKFIIVGVLIAIIVTLIIAGCIGTGPKPIQITYYYSSNCSACAQTDTIFDNLSVSHRGEFILIKYDIAKEQVKFYNDQITYHGDGSVPFIIIGNVTINGYTPDVEARLASLISVREQIINTNSTYK